LREQASEAIGQGEWDRAESLLDTAVRANPNDARLRRQLAEALWHRGQAAEALGQLDAAMALDPTEPNSCVRAGELCLACGEIAKAQTHAKRAIDLAPSLPAAWHLHARVMEDSGNSDQALADLNRALDLAPDDPTILLQMAELHRHRGQPRRALSTLEYLADRYPPGEEPGHVYYLQGLAYLALKRYHNAADVLLAATRHGETTAEAYYRLGEAHLLAGQPTAARVALAQAIARQPNHRPSRLLLDRIAHAGSGPTALQVR